MAQRSSRASAAEAIARDLVHEEENATPTANLSPRREI
jgi:hypothetical protein